MTEFKAFAVAALQKEDEKLDLRFLEEFMFSLNSAEPFPIPIEKLVEWQVYASKNEAKRGLDRTGFIKGSDFSAERLKNEEGQRGRPKTVIMLSVECFKFLCMLAQNDKGSQVRSYYLIIECLWKQYMEAEFKRHQEELEAKNNELVTTKSELADEQSVRIKLERNHNKLLKKRRHHKMKDGLCFYAWHSPATPTRHKIGITDIINVRLQTERTTAIDLHLDLLIYTDECKLLEDTMLARFRLNLVEPNHEVVNVEKDVLLAAVREAIKFLNLPHTEDEQLWQYNLECQDGDEETEIAHRQLKTAEAVERLKMKNQPPSKELLEAELAKSSISAVAETFGVSTTPVRRWISELGIDIKQLRRIEPSKEELVEAFKTRNQAEVAQHYGVSQHIIRKWLKGHGLSATELRMPQLSKPELSKLVKDDKLSLAQISKQCHLSVPTIKRLITEYEIETCPTKEQLLEDLKTKTKSEIVALYETSPQTLDRWLRIYETEREASPVDQLDQESNCH